MNVTNELLHNIARTARITVTEQEISQLKKDIQDILNAFSTLKEADTNNVQPSTHPTQITPVLREDTPEPSLSQEEALANSSATINGYFKGPQL